MRPYLNAVTAEEILAWDKRRSAFHEAGHCIAAQHFGLRWTARVVRVPHPATDEKTYVGQTHYQHTTKSRRAIIAWSGLIAEYLADKPVADWITEEMEVFEDVTFPNEYSATDCEGIDGDGQRRRSLKTAWHIVTTRSYEVARIADEMPVVEIATQS